MGRLHRACTCQHPFVCPLTPLPGRTNLAVVGRQRLDVPPHHVRDVRNDVLQGRKQLLQLGFDSCCVIHVGDVGPGRVGL